MNLPSINFPSCFVLACPIVTSVALVLSSCQEDNSSAEDSHSHMVPMKNLNQSSSEVCVVSGERLGARGAVYVHHFENSKVPLCCRKCVDDFDKDPERYLAMISAKLQVKARQHEREIPRVGGSEEMNPSGKNSGAQLDSEVARYTEEAVWVDAHDGERFDGKSLRTTPLPGLSGFEDRMVLIFFSGGGKPLAIDPVQVGEMSLPYEGAIIQPKHYLPFTTLPSLHDKKRYFTVKLPESATTIRP